jgi:hypothetical protein
MPLWNPQPTLASLGAAPTASPAFTGDPAAPTAPAGDDTTQLATDQFVTTAVGPYAKQTLASPAASITFSSIPAGYSLLRLVVVGASAAAAELDRWIVQVNGDTGAHYDLIGYGAQGGSGTLTEKNANTSWESGYGTDGDVPAASATAGVAGILVIEIPLYAGTTFQKAGLHRAGYSDAATSASDQSGASATIAWRSTAAITSVTVAVLSGSNLVAGTTAFLYLS